MADRHHDLHRERPIGHGIRHEITVYRVEFQPVRQGCAIRQAGRDRRMGRDLGRQGEAKARATGGHAFGYQHRHHAGDRCRRRLPQIDADTGRSRSTRSAAAAATATATAAGR